MLMMLVAVRCTRRYVEAAVLLGSGFEPSKVHGCVCQLFVVFCEGSGLCFLLCVYVCVRVRVCVCQTETEG